MNEQAFTKANLLQRILNGREQLDATLGRIPEKEMEEPLLHDGWSVKDVLGHLAFWEETVPLRFETGRAGREPEPMGDMDALNARVLADFRRLSLDEVRRREQAAYRRLLDMVADATSDELFKPGYFVGTGEHPFLSWIAGNTWGHYEEHLPEINAWLDKKS